MKKSVINELNALLKGENMAIKAYDRFINEVGDGEVRQELKNIQEEHKRHAEVLAGHISAIGGEPDGSTGFAGIMASAKGVVQGIGKRNSLDIIKEAYDGEDKGIAMAEEIVKGDIDEESKGVVNSILTEDHEHLSKMAHMMAQHGEDK